MRTTLELLFREGGRSNEPVVLLPQLPGAGIEPLVAALLGTAAGSRRVFPDLGPEAPAGAVREWHRDLCLALPQSERRSLVLATGPGAACLASSLDGTVEVVAVVREPLQALAGISDAPLPKRAELHALEAGGGSKMERLRAVANRQARALLLPWGDADELPVTLGPPPDAERWRALLFDQALPRLRVVRADDLVTIAMELAKRLGCPPKRTARIGQELSRPRPKPSGKPGRAELLAALNWLDTELYERCG